MKSHSNRISIISLIMFQMAFVKLFYISSYDSVRYVCIAVIGLFLLAHLKTNRAGTIRAQKVSIVLMLYLGTVLFFSYLNRANMQMRDPFLSAIVYCATLFEVYFVMKYMAANGRLLQMINTFYFLTFLYAALTDMLIFIKPALFMTHQRYYLIGDKFTVSYFHLFLAMLYMMRCKIKQKSKSHEKTGTLFFLCLAFVIAYSVNCTTGMVGTVFFFFLILISEGILCRPALFLVVMGISSTILLVSSNLLLNPFIRHFILNVLHKDITITGRMIIYRFIGSVMQGHWLSGYGVGSAYEICIKMLHFANLQNGVLDFIMEQGTISFVLLLFLIVAIFRDVKSYKAKKSIVFPVVVLLYVYVLLGSVEVTLSPTFMFLLILLFVSCLAEQIGKNCTDTDAADGETLNRKGDGYGSAGDD